MLALAVLLAGAAIGAHGGEGKKGGKPCPPLAIQNAIYDPQIASHSSIAAGGRVKILCEAGYLNSGAEWVVCGSDGNWQTASWSVDAAPSCQASCEPPQIENAEFLPSSAGTGMTQHGATVEVSCAEGYEFVGDKLIQCQHGVFSGLGDARCFLANESFCRDEMLTPLVAGALSHYAEDPLKATEYINKAVLYFKGIQKDGLSYIGLTPSPAYKSYESNAFYIPGITGSDATYQALVLPGAWNVTSVPAHMEMGSVYCRVFDEENELTAYVLKVLYKSNWGAFSLGQKK